jgi:hypothetical protein
MSRKLTFQTKGLCARFSILGVAGGCTLYATRSDRRSDASGLRPGSEFLLRDRCSGGAFLLVMPSCRLGRIGLDIAFTTGV